MIARRNYKGIEFIRLKDLSDELRTEIREWLSADVMIKIQTDNGLLNDCIQLKDFIYWYEHIYDPELKLEPLGKTHVAIKRKPLSLILQD